MQNNDFLNTGKTAANLWEFAWENKQSGFSTRTDTNRFITLQKQARSLKFPI